MKLLNRLLLVNWHYIRHQMIDFERINFLTGKNATGKSTIIDALQLLMLGETRGHYFNKAANDNSRRTLKGYLYGEKGYNESEGRVYLRKGIDFSSYLMAEFTNSSNNQYFTIGITFDCYEDGTHDSKFFILEDRIPENHFISESKTLSINELKQHMLLEYGKSKFEFFDSERGYRDALKNSMGRIKGDFFDLFRKAVPFSPIMNIKQFITEFVCETQKKVEIEALRENIRNYKTLEHHVKQIKDKVSMIEQIEMEYEKYLELKVQHRKEEYALKRSEYADKEIDLLNKIEQVKLKSVDHQNLLDQIKLVIVEANQNKVTLKKLNEEYYSSEDKNALEVLDLKISLAKTELDGAEQANLKITQQLGSIARSWSALLQELKSLPNFSAQSQVEQIINRLLSNLNNVPYEINESLLNDFQENLNRLLDEIKELRSQLRNRQRDLLGEQQDLEQRIQRLRSGIREYPNRELVHLQSAIIEELSNKHQVQVQAEIFCELLEIKDDRWKNAIEGFLNTQRFYLIVDPFYYDEALEIYDRLKFEHKFYDIGLLDIEKVLEKNPKALPGSLAEEIHAEHPWARAYADFLLGRVMKCENVNELRRNPTSITPSCMLYAGFVARQINPKVYQVPYIGRQSIVVQIQQAEARVLDNKIELEQEIKPAMSQFESWSKAPNLNDNEISGYIGESGWIAKANQREERNQIWLSLRNKKDNFDLTYLEQLKSKIHFEESLEIQLREKNNSLKISTALLEKEISQLNNDIPVIEEMVQQMNWSIQANYSGSWIVESGDPFFQELFARYLKLPILTRNLNIIIQETDKQMDEQYSKLVGLRTDYTKEYRGSLDNMETTNDSWSSEKMRLQNTTLRDYETQITSAKERASIEFQEDFIGKLKENIDVANEQIDELNYAIKQSQFGKNKYQFDIKPNPQYREYYKMITDDMLMDGRSIFTEVFMEKHGEVVDQLFQKIIYTGEDANTPEQARELEENLAKYTDYRTYLDFDLLEIDEQGNESSLSKVIATKSGGETQTPFYIAVLASFLQTYRVKSPNHNNTLRLIMFDEAFSKMDQQRIQECIKLVRTMGLQIIISAPSDKLADIAPLVDRNLCVMRVRNETIVKVFDPHEFTEDDLDAG
jgi:uncharacterized protein YPO0396